MTAALVLLSQSAAPVLPVLVTASGDRAGMRFLEFFAAQIRNPHTLRAGGGRVFGLVREQGRLVAGRGSAPACGKLDRAAGA